MLRGIADVAGCGSGAIVSGFAAVLVAGAWYDWAVVTVVQFGEFLVQRGRLDRYQLLRVLQFQARHPTTRLGECVVACGFLGLDDVEAELAEHASSSNRLARGTGSLPVVR